VASSATSESSSSAFQDTKGKCLIVVVKAY